MYLGITLICAAHGLIFLPVLLSYIGEFWYWDIHLQGSIVWFGDWVVMTLIREKPGRTGIAPPKKVNKT